MTGVAAPIAISHIAAFTSDLARHRAFYEGVIGLRTSLVLRMTHPPHLRHALYFVDERTALHVFEQRDFADAAGVHLDEMGRRGRLDHVGFMFADRAALEAVRDRLVAAGASDGEIRPLGPVLSVHFRDPDGLASEANAVNHEFDPDGAGELVEHSAGDRWFERMVAAVAGA